MTISQKTAGAVVAGGYFTYLGLKTYYVHKISICLA